MDYSEHVLRSRTASDEELIHAISHNPDTAFLGNLLGEVGVNKLSSKVAVHLYKTATDGHFSATNTLLVKQALAIDGRLDFASFKQCLADPGTAKLLVNNPYLPNRMCVKILNSDLSVANLETLLLHKKITVDNLVDYWNSLDKTEPAKYRAFYRYEVSKFDFPGVMKVELEYYQQFVNGFSGKYYKPNKDDYIQFLKLNLGEDMTSSEYPVSWLKELVDGYFGNA